MRSLDLASLHAVVSRCPIGHGLVPVTSAAGGGGWPLSGGWKGLEARGGAQRARERALEAARPPAPAFGSRAAVLDHSRSCDPRPLTGGSYPSSHASEGPAEAPASGSGRQAPGAVLGLQLDVRLVAAVGLLSGLSGDVQGGADLCPGGSLAAGCDGQQIPCICQRVLGVSHRFQGVQWPLRAASDPLQVLDHSTESPACVAGLVGGHVNGYCRSAPTGIAPESSISLDASICDTRFLDSTSTRVGSRAGCFSDVRYRPTTEKKRPRAAPTAGVMDDIRSI